ncbi:hypothetical protein ANN_13126 [Periplaneta americana]|uniref:Uncharacterized protein n=1 Tax=Periplaneta americana TaxID=6978 RepID=A0ABQ8TM09_PERAM|nr:hypothetical protein ANN_13126 [Periplaneta americana]
MAGLCEGGNEPRSSLKVIYFEGVMSPDLTILLIANAAVRASVMSLLPPPILTALNKASTGSLENLLVRT